MHTGGDAGGSVQVSIAAGQNLLDHVGISQHVSDYFPNGTLLLCHHPRTNNK